VKAVASPMPPVAAAPAAQAKASPPPEESPGPAPVAPAPSPQTPAVEASPSGNGAAAPIHDEPSEAVAARRAVSPAPPAPDGAAPLRATAAEVDRQLVDTCTRELDGEQDPARAARLHCTIALALGDSEKALDHFKLALKRLPDHLPSIRGARRLMLQRRNVKGASILFDAEIRLVDEPRRQAQLAHAKGRALEDVGGDTDGARRWYERAVELDPGCPAYPKALVQAVAQAEQWEALAGAYEQSANAVFDDDSQRAALIVERARVLEMRLGQVEPAIELYQHALSLDGGTAGARGALKRLLHAERRWRDLIEVLQEEAEQATDPGQATLALCEIATLHSERLGNRDEAIEALAQAMVRAKEPASTGDSAAGEALVLDRLGRLYESARNAESLAQVLARQVETMPDGGDRLGSLHRIGRLYEQQIGDDESAAHWYQAALQIEPAYVPAITALDPLLERAQRWEELVTLHGEVAEASVDSRRRAAARARIGEILESRLGRAEEAMSHHAAALGLAPGLEGSFKALTRLYAEAGRHRELIELYERRLDDTQDQDVVVAYLFRIGLLYEEALRDPGQALHAYRRILALRPDHLGAVHALQRAAERAYRHADLVEALELEAGLTQDRARQVALIQRAGDVLADSLGDREAAVLRFRRVLEMDKRFAPALSSLGRLYHQLGRHQDLLGVYEQELELAAPGPAQVALLYKLAELYEQQLGNAKDAVELYRRAIAQQPGHGPSLRALAHQLERQKDYDGLAEVLEAEVTSAPTPAVRAAAACRLGEVLEVHLDKLDEAEAAYGRALDAVPDHHLAAGAMARVRVRLDAWHKLADDLEGEADRAAEPARAIEALVRAAEVCRHRIGQPDRAVAAYEQVRVHQPDHVGALVALEGLYRRVAAWGRLAALYADQAEVLTDGAARIAALEEHARLCEIYGVGDATSIRTALTAILAIDATHAGALTALERLALSTDDLALLADVDTRAAQAQGDPAVLATHLVRLGQLLETTRPAEAIDAYRGALEHDGENIAAILGLGRAATALGDGAGLVEALRREASWTHSGAHAASLLARCAHVRLEQLGDAAGAVDDAQQALERWPDNVPAGRLLTDLLVQAGETDRLIELLTRAAGSAEQADRSSLLWCTVARLYADEKDDLAAALAALNRARKAGREDNYTLGLLGELYRRNRQWGEAAEALEEAAKLKPSTKQMVKLRLQLGDLYADHLKDDKGAISSFEAAVELDRTQREALAKLAVLYGKTGDQTGARNTAARLLETAGEPSEQANAMVTLGRIELLEGRKREAAKLLRQAVAIEGPKGSAVAEYKKLLGDEEPWERYVEALQSHLSRVQRGELSDDKLRDTYRALARIQHEVLLQVDEAVTTLREGLVACEGDPKLQRELADRLSATGRVDEAVTEYRQMIEADPTDDEVWRSMARTYHEAGRQPEAGVALAPLLVLGTATDREVKIAQQRRVRPGWAQPGSFDDTALQSISAGKPWGETPIQNLLTTMAEGIAKLYPPDYESYGVSRGDRVTERADHPLRPLCDDLAQAFGVTEYDLYVHGSPTTDVVAEVSSPAALMVPKFVSDLTSAERAFIIARAFAALARGMHPVVTLGRREVGRLVAAALQGVAPGHGTDTYGEDELTRLHKRLIKALPRRTRKTLEQAAQQFLAEPGVDLDRWGQTVELSSARAAALVAGDLPAAVAALRRTGAVVPKVEGPALVHGSVVVADLLRFWSTDAAFELRRSGGLL